jgi:hypothetical protein
VVTSGNKNARACQVKYPLFTLTMWTVVKYPLFALTMHIDKLEHSVLPK